MDYIANYRIEDSNFLQSLKTLCMFYRTRYLGLQRLQPKIETKKPTNPSKRVKIFSFADYNADTQ